MDGPGAPYAVTATVGLAPQADVRVLRPRETTTIRLAPTAPRQRD